MTFEEFEDNEHKLKKIPIFVDVLILDYLY